MTTTDGMRRPMPLVRCAEAGSGVARGTLKDHHGENFVVDAGRDGRHGLGVQRPSRGCHCL